MGLQIPLLIIDLRGVSIMSALFANRRVTHLRDTDTIWSKSFMPERITSAGFISLDTETGFRVKLHKVFMHVK